MTIEGMRAAVEAKPFKPFKIHTTDGATLEVASADHISMSPEGEEVLVWGKKGGFFVVDTLHVTKIEKAPKIAQN